jgi:nucleolar protein 15
MHSYFTQFGTVTRLRLSRNKKTGKSKHYGWIEFSSRDVAEIVADTMDGYLIHPHRLVCKVVEQVDENVWKGANKVFKRIPWQRIHKDTLEGKRTKERWGEITKRDEEVNQKRMDKIKELGIEYEFPLRGEKRKADEPTAEEEVVKPVREVKSKKSKTTEKAGNEKRVPSTQKAGKEKRITSTGSKTGKKGQK